jgi:hypothetical protein
MVFIRVHAGCVACGHRRYCFSFVGVAMETLASLNRRSENVIVHPVIVAELELGDRHNGQAFGNKPDRQVSNYV